MDGIRWTAEVQAFWSTYRNRLVNGLRVLSGVTSRRSRWHGTWHGLGAWCWGWDAMGGTVGACGLHARCCGAGMEWSGYIGLHAQWCWVWEVSAHCCTVLGAWHGMACRSVGCCAAVTFIQRRSSCTLHNRSGLYDACQFACLGCGLKTALHLGAAGERGTQVLHSVEHFTGVQDETADGGLNRFSLG